MRNSRRSSDALRITHYLYQTLRPLCIYPRLPHSLFFILFLLKEQVVIEQKPLAGKRALVTGVDPGGIGQGIAMELARQGAAVACHYPFGPRGAESVVQQVTENGGCATMIQGDFREGAQICTQVVDEAAEFLGGLDILINNAGVTKVASLLDVTQELFDELYAINVRSHLFCAQRAVRWMKQAGGGSIVSLASVHTASGAPGFSVYAGTKGAISSMTRQLAVELGPQRIRVNAIAPGLIEVPRYHDNPTYNRESYIATVPWGRLGAPADIGRTAAFLASDAADFITGQVIYVDGGTTAYMSFSAHLAGQQWVG
jgi:NAD(P)-dependent dehydrogenase (short-subunit alcohol dehydrogenase family)